jgi:hypothetical protein
MTVAKAKHRRLKVFQAQIGFYDTVVAAPSQAAALRAWGVHQNLFANGEARLTDNEEAGAAAIAHPETPLRRAVGSSDPFVLEPASLPKAPKAPRKSIPKTLEESKPGRPKKPPADRAALTAAEAALRRLDAERAAAQRFYVEHRKSATGAVVAARDAYREAGGAD